MSGRQLLRLAVLLGVLLLLWTVAAMMRRGGYDPGEGEAFAPAGIDRALTDSVRIVAPEDTTVLARKDSATWTVNGHLAAGSAVSDLFAALSDTTARSELVAERPGSHEGLRVDSSGGTRIRIYHGDTLAMDLIMGQRSADLDGGYFRQAGDSAVYLVRGRLAEVLGRDTDAWRDRRIAAVARDSVTRIDIRRGRRSYLLRRGEQGWTLDRGMAADSSAVGRLLEAYAHVEAGGFASPAQADSARFDRADRLAVLRGGGEAPLLTLAFDSTQGGFWVRADSGSTVFRLDSWSADRLTPADSTLRSTAADR